MYIQESESDKKIKIKCSLGNISYKATFKNKHQIPSFLCWTAAAQYFIVSPAVTVEQSKNIMVNI